MNLLYNRPHQNPDKTLSCVTETDGICKIVIRVRAGGLENVQHAGTGDVPHLRTELLPVQDHQVLQTVCA